MGEPPDEAVALADRLMAACESLGTQHPSKPWLGSRPTAAVKGSVMFEAATFWGICYAAVGN